MDKKEIYLQIMELCELLGITLEEAWKNHVDPKIKEQYDFQELFCSQ